MGDRAYPVGLLVAAVLAAGVSFRPSTLTSAQTCVADCDGDGDVTVDELMKCVNIALEYSELSICPVCDADGSGQVTIDELVRGINAAIGKCPPAATGTPTLSFPPPTATPEILFTVGGNIYSTLAAGDFDADGNVDLAVASCGGTTQGQPRRNAVFISLGTPDGFAAPQQSAVGDCPQGIAVAEINGDRIADLIVSSGDSDGVSVLLGNGRGGFSAARQFVSGLKGDGPVQVAVGDVNGDGKADLVATEESFGAIALLFGDGHGGFSDPVFEVITLERQPSVSAPVLADVDRDGALDILVIAGPDVVALMGNGHGEFRRNLLGRGRESLAVAEVNGDGIADILVGSETDAATQVLLGNADGSFSAAGSIAMRGNLIAADLNHDGLVDIVARGSDVRFGRDFTIVPIISVAIGKGGGHFSMPATYGVGEDSGLSNLVVVDANHDGNVDVLVPHAGAEEWHSDGTIDSDPRTGDVLLLAGRGDGMLLAPLRIPAGTRPSQMVVADVNRDGSADVVVGSDDDLRVPINASPRGTFGESQRIELQPAIPPGPRFVVADIDKNGTVDLIVGAGSYVSRYDGVGDGTFTLGEYTGNFGRGVTPLAVADFNGDGLNDLLASVPIVGRFGGPFVQYGREDTGRYTLLTGPSSGLGELGGRYFSATVGYLNPDGLPDLVFADGSTNDGSSDSILVLRNAGDGTFTAPALYASPGGHPLVAVAADVDGDGRADLVTANSGSNDISVFLGTIEDAFVLSGRSAVGDKPSALLVADLNRDGRPDIVVANSGSSDISVLLGHGGGSFAPQRRFPVSAEPSSVGVADFDEDGFLDLAVANKGTADVYICRGRGDGSFVSVPPTVATARSGSS